MTREELVGDTIFSELRMYNSQAANTQEPKDTVAFSFIDDTGTPVHRVLFDNMSGQLVDPTEFSSKPVQWVFKKINPKGFQCYLNFLENGSEVNFIKARQELFHGA